MSQLLEKLRQATEVFAYPKEENEVSDDKGVNVKEPVIQNVESIFKKPHRAAGKLTLSERKVEAGGTEEKKEVSDESNRVKAPEAEISKN